MLPMVDHIAFLAAASAYWLVIGLPAVLKWLVTGAQEPERHKIRTDRGWGRQFQRQGRPGRQSGTCQTVTTSSDSC